MSHSGNFEKGTSPVRECNMGLIPFPNCYSLDLH
jgi:hypothetical protein